MKKENVHIGDLIRQKMKEKGMTHEDFGNKYGCSRQNVSNILNLDDVGIKHLKRISKILDYDFIKHISEESSLPIKHKFVIEVMGENVTITKIE